MPKIDFEEINSACIAQSQTLLDRWLPGGKFIEGEYCPLNPTRSDKTPGSFRIDPHSGSWIDFATNDKGKDYVSLYAYLTNQKQGDAAKELRVHLGLEAGSVKASTIPVAKPTPVNTPAKPQPIIPAPSPAPISVINYKGTPSAVYHYKNAEGQTIGYTLRYDHADGTKDVKPLFYFPPSQWKFKGISQGNPRPIYGLDRLANNPEKPVVIVEGEKAADFGQKILPDYVVVTWLGGTATAAKTEWSSLLKREVYIWPDNDEPGFKAADKIKKALPNARIMQPLEGKPRGWDAADATPDEAFLVLNPPPKLPVKESEETIADNRYFRCVGFISLEWRSLFVFYSKIRKSILGLRSTQITWESLQELADTNWWEARFPDFETKTKRVDFIRERLIQECSRLGVFDPDKIRGRGVWMEAQKVVCHIGDRLLVDGRETDLTDHESDYVYQQGRRINAGGEAIDKHDGFRFFELCCEFNWDTDISGVLLAGWIFLAPVCGGLRWRPHIWITGLAGTGKSWIFEFIIQEALGNFGLKVQSETTEAGLRQRLGNDALPVVFDEAESENQKADQRIQNVMGLMRQASSNSSGAILKGSAGGVAQSFSIRSMFAFASILPGLTQASDKTRVSILNLKSLDHSEATVSHFERVKTLRRELYTPEYLNGLRMRAVGLLPVIRDSVKLFSEMVSEKIGNKRLGDQVGTLLAGAWCLQNDEVPTRQQAGDFINLGDWEEEKNLKNETDYHRMLEYLCQQTVQSVGRGGKLDISIGEMIVLANRKARGHLFGTASNDYMEDSIKRELARYGIRVDADIAYIANSNSLLQRVLKNTPWSKNWKNLLLPINGAYKPSSPIRFGFGFKKQRAIAIPIDAFSLDTGDEPIEDLPL